MISISSQGENSIRGFQQLVVDAVELAGSISLSLKAQLVSILGSTFPSGISPTIDHQKASLPAVLRMLVYARHEADREHRLNQGDGCTGGGRISYIRRLQPVMTGLWLCHQPQPMRARVFRNEGSLAPYANFGKRPAKARASHGFISFSTMG
jgi:hypothetical protein